MEWAPDAFGRRWRSEVRQPGSAIDNGRNAESVEARIPVCAYLVFTPIFCANAASGVNFENCKKSSNMKVSVLCSSESHPIYPHLQAWVKNVDAFHQVELV